MSAFQVSGVLRELSPISGLFPFLTPRHGYFFTLYLGFPRFGTFATRGGGSR